MKKIKEKAPRRLWRYGWEPFKRTIEKMKWRKAGHTHTATAKSVEEVPRGYLYTLEITRIESEADNG